MEKADETAVPGGIYLTKSRQGARGGERGVLQSIDRAAVRLTREELIRFGEGFVRLSQPVPRQRGELSPHRGAPSVSSARMKGVRRHTGSAKTLRAITRGEI